MAASPYKPCTISKTPPFRLVLTHVHLTGNQEFENGDQEKYNLKSTMDDEIIIIIKVRVSSRFLEQPLSSLGLGEVTR